jgi:uncharacterized protein (DUF697 family)
MHDLDRTQQFVESGSMELEADNEFGLEAEGEWEGGEEMEMELAAELLSVNNEEELEEFIGSLFKKAVSGVKNFAKSSAGKALGGMLKGVIKKTLPIAGGAIGSFIAPGVGTAIGSSLGGMAGKALGLELEGLSAEDQELEVSKTLIRLGTDAAKKAAAAAQHGGDPRTVARHALAAAAKSFAPGLLNAAAGAVHLESPERPWSQGSGGGSYQGHHRSGRWVRRGSTIVLYGV